MKKNIWMFAVGIAIITLYVGVIIAKVLSLNAPQQYAVDYSGISHDGYYPVTDTWLTHLPIWLCAIFLLVGLIVSWSSYQKLTQTA